MPSPVVTIDCGDRLDLTVLKQRRDEWLQQIEHGRGLCLDVGRLTTVDAAGVQLLLAAEQECRIRNLSFTLGGSSTALSSATGRLGLADWGPVT